MSRAWLLVLAACAACAACGACGASPAPSCPDGGPCNGACPAALAGNFDETTSAPANCATFAPPATLTFSLPSRALGNPIAISIDLGGAAAAGTYSSDTIATWSAIVARSIGDDGACVYSAGDQVVPHGSFTLALASIDPAAGVAHGALDVTMFVHAVEGTDCGAADTETVHVEF